MKRVFSWVLLLCLALSMAGCGPGEAGPSDSVSSAPSAEASLTGGGEGLTVEQMFPARTADEPSEWAKEATNYCKKKGIFNGDGAGNYGWKVPITREAVAQIIYNAFERAGILGNITDA